MSFFPMFSTPQSGRNFGVVKLLSREHAVVHGIDTINVLVTDLYLGFLYAEIVITYDGPGQGGTENMYACMFYCFC